MKKIIGIIAVISFVLAMTSCSTSNSLSTNKCYNPKKCNKAAYKIYKKSPKVWCSKGAFNEW